MKIDKIKLSNIIFYISFGLLCLKTIFYFSNISPFDRESLKYLSIFVLGLLLVKNLINCYKDYKKVITYGLVFLLLALVSLYTNTTTIALLFAFLISIDTHLNIKTVAKIHLGIFSFSLLLHLVMGELQYSGLVDFEKYGILSYDELIRGKSFFYCYYNTAGAIFIGDIFSIIYLVKDRARLRISYLLLPLVFIAYFVTTSRTILIFYLIYLLIYSLTKISFIDKFVKIIAQYVSFLLGLFSVFLMSIVNTRVGGFINNLFSTRFSSAYVAYKEYGISFLPQRRVIFDFFNTTKYVLDNVYLRYIILYGVITFLIISLMFFVVNKKQTRFTSSAFVSLAIAGLSENYALDICVTIILMLVFFGYKKRKEMEKMEAKDKISIIVANYNGEKFLKRCLNSLINQSYQNIEIIVIDDGSEDNSLKILKEYARRDSRIILIENTNHGVSYSRNCGLNIASGDYIMFVDSDDFADENACYYLIKKELETNAAIIKYGFYSSYRFLDRKYKFKNITNQLLKTNELKYVLTSNDCCNVNNLFLKREIALSTKFDDSIKMGEDYLYTTTCIKKAKNIYFMKDAYYYYCFNVNSFTFNLNKEKILKIMDDTETVNQKIVEMKLANKGDILLRDEYIASKNLEKLLAFISYEDYLEYIKLFSKWGVVRPIDEKYYKKMKVKCKLKRLITMIV